MADSTSFFHVEFIGSNLGRDKDPLSKVEEIESILDEQHVNGYIYDGQLNLPQAQDVVYVYMIFKKKVDDANVSEETVVKKRIRKKRW